MSKNITFLHHIKNRYLVLQGVEVFLLAASFSVLAFCLLRLLSPSFVLQLSGAAFVFLSATFTSIYRRGLYKTTLRDVAAYLSHLYPSLQQSTDLLLKESVELSNLQALQRSKVEKEFDRLKSEVKLPHHLGKTLAILSLCLISSILFFRASPLYSSTSETNLAPLLQQAVAITDSAQNSLEELTLHIQAPAYTGMKAAYANSLSPTVPEGSQLSWSMRFTYPCENVWVVVSGRDSLVATAASKSDYLVKYTVSSSLFYQVHWQYKGNNFQSDFYKLESTVDEAPQITVNNLTQFTALKHTDNLTISMEASIRDDYGLEDANIIATVSKGSGESVKFREEKMRFASPTHITGKQVSARTTFNLLKLGLEPGDELYFYVQAEDAKTPQSNRSRTETFIISLQDTANLITSADEGLGVDLMPEYFRSQRQIIIDSEKLLKNRKTISKEEFNFTSNALGYDQKVLRLRYSEFMGEEFVSGIGPEVSHEEEGDEEESDVVKEFGHVHDSENEHNLVEEKHDHKHEEKSNDPDKKENPIEEFAHLHDDTEEATFYIQSVKAKLRAALTMMWDAELHLRLFDPQKSLPYQYKILNLLKEIANDSRIYVHRSGFDPPPIKEDKRYTADLSEIHNSTNRYTVTIDDRYSRVREAIALLNDLQQSEVKTLSEQDKMTLTHAGQALAALSVEEPVRYLQGLRSLHALTNTTQQVQDLPKLLDTAQRELWKSLPSKERSISPSSLRLHALDKALIQHLEDTHD